QLSEVSDFSFNFLLKHSFIPFSIYLVPERKPLVCHFDRREKSFNASILNIIRFLAPLEMTALDSFRSGII
ncbi:MAG: hypothetical protein KAU60_12245, partial [Desulfobacterales bacterium]|nr:hypothetical protein [Desulfobacterales bacterium]